VDVGRYGEDMSLRTGRKKKASRAKCRLFLETYSRGANITEACRVAGIARSVITYLRETDEAFQIAFQQAHDTSVDALISECRRRAIIGDSEPTGWYQGQPGGYVTRRSDNLLMFMIKKEIPEYRDKWEVTGANGQPLQITVAAYGVGNEQNKGYLGSTAPDKSPDKSDSGADPGAGPGAAGPAVEVEVTDVKVDR